MTWLFDNDTKNIVKTIARNDITKNRNKKIFSIITISLATALLMTLAMFESGYEISKDRQTVGQPQVIFSEVSDQQVSWLRSDEHIETIIVTDTQKGHDAQVTIIDATKMTQYGFTTVVNKIASQYNIRRVIKSELFMDSLPDGGLLNQKNTIIVVISFFVVFVSALVIYNVFYLSVINQIQQFGQLRTIGMTQKQIKTVIRYERKHLCKISIPVGLLIGGFIGYLLQPKGWDWGRAIILSLLIAFAITFVVKISLSKPAKVASSISPINSSKYIGSMNSYNVSHKLKRRLSPLGLSMISITANWKKEMVSLLSLGLCGVLFVLAATYSASIDVKTIVEKEIIATRNITVKQVSTAIISITLFLLFFSIITFTSTIITSIATRKREYAMLQSIGMKRKQVEVMALGENIILVVGSLLITLFLGIILGQLMIRSMIDMGIFYLSYTFPLKLYVLYCLSILLVIMLITFSAFRIMQKVSLVDRLRITE